MQSLFITGSGGFIGRRLLQRLDSVRYNKIYCLSRSPSVDLQSISSRDKFHPIHASILDPKSYASHLTLCDTVVHLAAVTGKRPPAEYFAINTEGTKVLLEQCKQAGVRRFLHISSIAVKYPEKSMYYYAQSKELSEIAVKESGLAYSIVRPTIVIGRDSPAWQSLVKLAKLPVIPIFGNGRSVIQPIYVNDLVDCLITLLNEDLFRGDTIELGGPEPISFQDFLSTIHWLYQGKKARTIHLPLTPIVFCLSLLQKPFYSILPITVGQLSAFRNDGRIDSNQIFEQQRPYMKGIDEMLRACLEDE